VFPSVIVRFFFRDRVEPGGILKESDDGSLDCMDWHAYRNNDRRRSVACFMILFSVVEWQGADNGIQICTNI
jgi:hypothetical protein